MLAKKIVKYPCPPYTQKRWMIRFKRFHMASNTSFPNRKCNPFIFFLVRIIFSFSHTLYSAYGNFLWFLPFSSSCFHFQTFSIVSVVVVVVLAFMILFTIKGEHVLFTVFHSLSLLCYFIVCTPAFHYFFYPCESLIQIYSKKLPF